MDLYHSFVLRNYNLDFVHYDERNNIKPKKFTSNISEAARYSQSRVLEITQQRLSEQEDLEVLAMYRIPEAIMYQVTDDITAYLETKYDVHFMFGDVYDWSMNILFGTSKSTDIPLFRLKCTMKLIRNEELVVTCKMRKTDRDGEEIDEEMIAKINSKLDKVRNKMNNEYKQLIIDYYQTK